MLSVLVVIYGFLKTLTEQGRLLHADKDRYDAVLFTQRLMGQKVDSLYFNLSLLNTGLVRSNRPIEERILREKNELDTLLAQRLFERRPHEVYRKVSGYVNEMLVLKDSIASVEAQVRDIRQELRDCQRNEQLKK